MRVNYAIVFVSNMKRAVSFYRDVLGLPLKFESPGWSEFASDGATLALHASEGSNSERDNPQKVPAGRHNGFSRYIVLAAGPAADLFRYGDRRALMEVDVAWSQGERRTDEG